MVSLLNKFKTCVNIEYRTAGNDVNYQFIEKDDELEIYFQGSSSMVDWFRNFFFKKVPYKDMKIPYKVHAGFLKAWKEVEDIIIEKILEPEDPDDVGRAIYNYGYKWKHITITGYSHGAALAVLCHECVWYWRQDLRNGHIMTYAFEAPRVIAQWRLKKELADRWLCCFVYRNKNDIVTHVPFVLLGYRHVGKLMKIGQKKKLIRHTAFRCVDAHYPDNVENSLTD